MVITEFQPFPITCGNRGSFQILKRPSFPFSSYLHRYSISCNCITSFLRLSTIVKRHKEAFPDKNNILNCSFQIRFLLPNFSSLYYLQIASFKGTSENWESGKKRQYITKSDVDGMYTVDENRRGKNLTTLNRKKNDDWDLLTTDCCS